MKDTFSIYSDDEIVDSLKDGNIKAFELLYNKNKEKMYNIALRINRNYLDAEDSVQETFVKIYKKIKSFEGKAKLSTWIYKILVNTCLENIRKNKKLSRTDTIDFTDNMEPTDRQGSPSLKFILEREISGLPVELRAVFLLYEVEGFTHKDISEIMSIPVGTSKSHLFKSKKLLRKCLEPYLEIFKGIYKNEL